MHEPLRIRVGRRLRRIKVSAANVRERWFGRTPELAVQAMSLLAEKGVTATIGPPWSSMSLGALPDHSDGVGLSARAHDMLLISPSATSSEITGLSDDDLQWRTTPSDAVQASVAATTLVGEGIMTAAVLSAIMSTADSQLLVAASAVSHDLGLSGASQRSTLLVTRLVVLLVSAAAVLTALFGSQQIFDSVLIAVSVQYLTRPVEVFREIARVLRPGGSCLVAVSHRTFPTKCVSLFASVPPAERPKIVARYATLAGGFEDRRQMSHDRADHGRVDQPDVEAVEIEEPSERQGQFVSGTRRPRAQPPVVEHIVAANGADRRLSVADVDGEDHTPVLATVRRACSR